MAVAHLVLVRHDRALFEIHGCSSNPAIIPARGRLDRLVVRRGILHVTRDPAARSSTTGGVLSRSGVIRMRPKQAFGSGSE